MQGTTHLAALAAASPGLPQVVESSSGLGWQGLHLERHRCAPGPRESHHVDRPVLIMLCSATSFGEHRDLCGNFASYRKARGAFTSIPEGPATELRLLVETELACAAFDPGYLASVASELEAAPREIRFQSGIHDAPLQSLLELLLNALPTHHADDTLYADSVVHALTIRFLRWHGMVERFTVSDKPAATASRLQRVRELIEANLEHPLGLEMLAREAGYTRSHFARWFRASTGRTVHSFVTALRVDRAKLMLGADLPLAHVAAACGFASQSHMTQLFRRLLGTTPAAYRRQLWSGRTRSHQRSTARYSASFAAVAADAFSSSASVG